MRTRCRVAGERGSIAPATTVSALVLAAVLAFSVDQALALALKSRQENALDAVRSSCMGASQGLVAKNSECPGDFVARSVNETLREGGFEGEAVVWFYEAPDGEVAQSRRLWAVGIQVSEDSPTVFARGFGLESIPVASKGVVVAEPFSDTLAWRPSDSGSGRYVFAAGSGASDPPAFERKDGLASYPKEVVCEVQAAKESRADGVSAGREDPWRG